MVTREASDCQKNNGNERNSDSRKSGRENQKAAHSMKVKTLILGAGAAGLFCASRAGRGTLIVDHAKAAGEKIRISGGGRCNFTNLDIQFSNFICGNPHFHKSALSQFTQWDFIELVSNYGIAWHEKTLGQLFCDETAKDIVAMLRSEMEKAGADLWLQTEIVSVEKVGDLFQVSLLRQGKPITVEAENLVVATGGKSIPKMGATGIAYKIAAEFDLAVTETRAGLVPFTFDAERFRPLAGLSTEVSAKATWGPSFTEGMLFTHRGLSGPAMLQISSYWRQGEAITVNLSPKTALGEALKAQKRTAGKKNLTTILAGLLPARLVEHLSSAIDMSGNIADWSDKRLGDLAEQLHAWELTPTGSEGYRTAEVTLGGIDTDELSSKTMEAKKVKGLYFIGECVDVTGWLGGYNFQWAWSSAAAAGRAITSS